MTPRTRHRATNSKGWTTRSSRIGRRSAAQGGARDHSVNLAVGVLGAGGANAGAGAGRVRSACGGRFRRLTSTISRRSMAIALPPQGPAGRRRRNGGVSSERVRGGVPLGFLSPGTVAFRWRGFGVECPCISYPPLASPIHRGEVKGHVHALDQAQDAAARRRRRR